MCALYVFQGHKADAERKERQLELLCQEYHDLQEQVRNDEKRVREAIETSTKAQEELQRIQLEYENIASEREDMQRRERQYEEEVAQLQRKLKQKEHQYKELEQKHSDALKDIDEMNQELDFMNKRNHALAKEKDDQLLKIKQLELKVSGMIDTDRKHKKAEAELKTRNDELREWLKKKEDARKRFELASARKSVRIDGLQKELGKMKKFLGAEKMARLNAQQEVEDIQQQLKVVIKKNRKMEDDFQEEYLRSKQRDAQLWATREKNLQLVDQISVLEREKVVTDENEKSAATAAAIASAMANVQVFHGPVRDQMENVVADVARADAKDDIVDDFPSSGVPTSTGDDEEGHADGKPLPSSIDDVSRNVQSHMDKVVEWTKKKCLKFQEALEAERDAYTSEDTRHRELNASISMVDRDAEIARLRNQNVALLQNLHSNLAGARAVLGMPSETPTTSS